MSQAEVIIWSILVYLAVFLYGLLVGSFLNVVILRVPLKQSVSKKRSHCMSCGYQLEWFDLIPLFSWLALKGKCRKCGAKISAQYPIVEASNALLGVLVFHVFNFKRGFILNGLDLYFILICLLTSALLALSVIDFRTYIIPPGFNYFILALGVINIIGRIVKIMVIDNRGDFKDVNLPLYVIGFFAVSVPLLLIYIVSKGRAIGGGDIKLMAAAGFLLGWKCILLALFIGCLVGSIIHIARMKISKADHVLAMGPYLSVGIFIAALWGDKLINWYFSLLPKPTP